MAAFCLQGDRKGFEEALEVPNTPNCSCQKDRCLKMYCNCFKQGALGLPAAFAVTCLQPCCACAGSGAARIVLVPHRQYVGVVSFALQYFSRWRIRFLASVKPCVPACVPLQA